MSRRQFAINSGASTLNLFIQFSVNFFLTGYLVARLGSTAYGFFALACTVVNYATIISNALNSMSARFVGYEYFNNNLKGAIKYYSSVLYGDMAFVAILLLPAIVFLFNIDGFIDIPPDLENDVKLLFLLVFLNLCVSVGGAVFSIVYVIKDRLDLSSVREIVSNLLRAGILVALYSIFDTSIVYLGIASLTAAVYVLTVNYYASRKLMPEIRPDFRSVKIGAIGEIAGAGIWNSLNQLSILLLHGLDLLICNKMVSPLAMGYLSVATTLPNAVSSCISSFSYIFTPRFLEHFSHHNFEALVADVRNSIKFMTVISCIPITFLVGFGLPFYRLWTPNTDVNTVFLLSVLVVLPNFTGAAINSVNFLYSVVNKVKWPAIVLLCTGVLNVVLIFILLKATDWGIYVVVIVSAALGLLRNIVFNAPYAALCIKQKFYAFYKDLFTSFALLSLGCALSWSINSFIGPDNWVTLILTGGTVSLLIAIANAMLLLSKQQRKFLVNKLLRR